MANPLLNTHIVYPKRYMVATGTLESGLTWYGPFVTVDECTNWAKDNVKPMSAWSWHVVNDVRGK